VQVLHTYDDGEDDTAFDQVLDGMAAEQAAIRNAAKPPPGATWLWSLWRGASASPLPAPVCSTWAD
jgi:hypothetical protein